MQIVLAVTGALLGGVIGYAGSHENAGTILLRAAIGFDVICGDGGADLDDQRFLGPPSV